MNVNKAELLGLKHTSAQEMCNKRLCQHHLTRSEHTTPPNIRSNFCRAYWWEVFPVTKPHKGLKVFDELCYMRRLVIVVVTLVGAGQVFWVFVVAIINVMELGNRIITIVAMT